MAQSTKPAKTRTRAAAGKKRPAATRRRGSPPNRRSTAVARTTDLSDELLQSVEDGQRAAIDAVHKFVDKVDRLLPALPREEGPTRRQELVDSALEMADRLVHTQYDFVRKVIDSAGKSLSSEK